MLTIFHLLISLLILFIMSNFINIQPVMAFSFVLGSIIIDIDHLITIYHIKKEPYNTARKLLKSRQIRSFLIFLSKRHKEIDLLRFHNYVGFLLIFLTFEITLLLDRHILELLFLSILTHMVEDQLEDIWTLGHLKNWLWPFNMARGCWGLVVLSIALLVISYIQIWLHLLV